MKKIINVLKKKHFIPLDQFIDIALYDKKSGYYMKKNPLGKKGDFITSPLVSSLFSEMIAIWCVAFWEHLGKPKKFLIVELGPGDASLCLSMLSVFKNFKLFYNSLEIKLLEKSSKLENIQKIKIKNKKVRWIKNINNLKYGPIIFIGNEFFDSLPIKQLYKKNNLFYEKYIGFKKNSKKLEFKYKKTKNKLIKRIKEFDLINKGSVIEFPIASIQFLNIISKRIKKYGGGLLAIDYGYTKKKNQDTLQAVKGHEYTNILSDPGNADITSHINYNLFLKILKKNNLRTEKIVTQNEFLQKLGIIERANLVSKKMNFRAKTDMFYKLKRLLSYNEMGKIFKVLFAQKKGIKFTLGF